MIINDFILNQVVTNGLLLYLDSGNLSSYPGSGVTWTDLTGNGRNFSLNVPAYYSYDTVTQSLRFSRTMPPATETGAYAEYTGTGALTSASYLYTNHTTEVWARINNINPTNYNATEPLSALVAYVGFHSMFQYTSGYMQYAIWKSNSSQAGPTCSVGLSGADINQSSWFQIAATRNVNSVSLYVNGTLKSALTIDAPSSSVVTNIIRIACANLSANSYSWHADANVASLRMYNRALSDSEIAQNFSANRWRFGI